MLRPNWIYEFYEYVKLYPSVEWMLSTEICEKFRYDDNKTRKRNTHTHTQSQIPSQHIALNTHNMQTYRLFFAFLFSLFFSVFLLVVWSPTSSSQDYGLFNGNKAENLFLRSQWIYDCDSIQIQLKKKNCRANGEIRFSFVCCGRNESKLAVLYQVNCHCHYLHTLNAHTHPNRQRTFQMTIMYSRSIDPCHFRI